MTLAHLETIQHLVPWEIIVVSDGGGAVPTDPPFDCVSGMSQQHGGVARARNFGAQHARASVLAFLDDDVHPTKTWADALNRFVTSDQLAVTGPVHARDQSIISRARSFRYERRYRGLVCGDAVNFLAGGNSLIRRDAFFATGGFPATGLGSDNELSARLGRPPQFCWALAVTHKNDRGFPVALMNALTSGWADARRSRPIGSLGLDNSDIAPSAVNLLLHGARVFGWVSGRAWRRAN